jgi:hypothetical protein
MTIEGLDGWQFVYDLGASIQLAYTLGPSGALHTIHLPHISELLLEYLIDVFKAEHCQLEGDNA